MPAHRTFDRERAANIIIEALELGLSPTRTIVEICGVTEAQARYQVRTVRTEGLLGVAPHFPTRVHLHPRSAREVVFLACDHCHMPYPCEAGFPYGLPMEPLKKIKKTRRRRST